MRNPRDDTTREMLWVIWYFGWALLGAFFMVVSFIIWQENEDSWGSGLLATLGTLLILIAILAAWSRGEANARDEG